MDKALEMGINHFDTANQYGGDGNWGRTERILGNWFRARGKRQEIVLATKVSANMGDQIGQNGVHAINIKRSCEASLKRLQTDHIDLYIMHHIDRNVHPEEWMQAMEQLVREGKILYVGSSNFPGWNIAQAMELQKRRNFLGLVSEQHLYNLARRPRSLRSFPPAGNTGWPLHPIPRWPVACWPDPGKGRHPVSGPLLVSRAWINPKWKRLIATRPCALNLVRILPLSGSPGSFTIPT
jgi:aryl-alcohol dehydrogenase-like predicted oxidoreductase